jgi:dihydrofolate synthase/folylpolyglutamate synthase
VANAEGKISAFQKFGWKLGLERMRGLCSLLGDPQASLRVIHVAGTNGKGSVCRYLYEVLLAHGYSVGIFTSPGLGDFRSRIEANGEWISESDLDNCTNHVLSAVERMAGAEDSPTEFEVLTAVAFEYFASKNLDFVILEVGLGGSLDSTNVIEKPLVSVITEIALDHTEYLGDTIEKIAGEKAGIIKAGCPVVVSATGEAARVIARKAYELGVPLVDARADVRGSGVAGSGGFGGAAVTGQASGGISCRISREDICGTLFSCAIRGTRYDGIEISMVGRHQVRNAVCALAAFDTLRGMKLVTSDSSALRSGMKAASLAGRFQVVSGGDGGCARDGALRESQDGTANGLCDAAAPLVIFDGAHNPSGAAALRAAVSAFLPNRKVLVLAAMMKDKSTDDMLNEIHGFAQDALFTEASNGRSMSADELAKRWRQVTGEDLDGGDLALTAPTAIKDPIEAYGAALNMAWAGGFGALVVTGSLYLISDLAGKAR